MTIRKKNYIIVINRYDAEVRLFFNFDIRNCR